MPPSISTPEPVAGYRPNVGLMLLNPDGRVFVGRRKDTPDAWQMPQGGIDAGETPAEAALRELAEEAGTDRAEILFEISHWLSYALPAAIAGKAWRGHWKGQSQKWFALRFTGTDADIRITTEHPEFDAWQWLPRADLTKLIVPFKRPVYEAVLEEMEPRLKLLGY
jgi:putative (di)nucleoside polyphosphate hydrolase